jgi:hypothetical protein
MEEVKLHKEREVGRAMHLPRARSPPNATITRALCVALAAPNGLRRKTSGGGAHRWDQNDDDETVKCGIQHRGRVPACSTMEYSPHARLADAPRYSPFPTPVWWLGSVLGTEGIIVEKIGRKLGQAVRAER